MAKQQNLHFRKGDVLAIAAVLLLAVFVALLYLPEPASGPAVVQIWLEGELVKELSLEEDTVCTVNHTTVTVKEGKAAVTDSDCPDKDCVKTGPVRTSGRSIVCLPNALEVRVVNGAYDVDFVVG